MGKVEVTTIGKANLKADMQNQVLTRNMDSRTEGRVESAFMKNCSQNYRR